MSKEFVFVEMNTNRYQSFRFEMPEIVTGIAGITYIVEFVPMAKDQIGYDVWCEIDATYMRGFIFSGELHKVNVQDIDSLIDKIIVDMNRREDELARLTLEWREFVGEVCSGDPDDDEEDSDD